MAGTKLEVYGFVCWIATFFCFGCFLLWAYLPESVLHQLGVTYYPDKYWAIAIPTYLFMSYLVAVIIYLSVNLITTEPLDSFNTITGN
jgi:phosphatidylinositol glycan class P protein